MCARVKSGATDEDYKCVMDSDNKLLDFSLLVMLLLGPWFIGR